MGATAISQGLEQLGIKMPQAVEASQTAYETEDLVWAIENGKMLVCGRPEATTEVDPAAALLWPLHDNVFHLYSNILLQTVEFTDFVKRHGANNQPAALDGYLAAAGARLHGMSAPDWYSKAQSYAPYRQFRYFLQGFINQQSEGSMRLAEELEALKVLDNAGSVLDDESVFQGSLAIVDRPGNMLDQLDPIVSSIVSRFVAINSHRY